eukprot:m.264584 g.264584  ORF g.264584 m.264584 type:complete len:84 (+) comp27979_c0_seq1:134-385(+)
MNPNDLDPETRMFIQREQARAEASALTDICWPVCVPSTPGSRNIGSGSDSKTDKCLQNCVSAFLETTELMYRRLAQKASGGGM